MPSRTPAPPVVVDGVTWIGVLRPDRGHVTFHQACEALRARKLLFDRDDVEPAFFQLQDDGTYKTCPPSTKGTIVGWLITT